MMLTESAAMMLVSSSAIGYVPRLSTIAPMFIYCIRALKAIYVSAMSVTFLSSQKGEIIFFFGFQNFSFIVFLFAFDTFNFFHLLRANYSYDEFSVELSLELLLLGITDCFLIKRFPTKRTGRAVCAF